MRTIAQVLLLFALAGAIGLGLTALAIHHAPGFEAVKVGPWRAAPQDEQLAADPYALAAVAATGALPLARSDGIAFRATTDEEGRALDGACVYRIAGPVPSTRVWTLTANTRAGGVFRNPAERFAFASGEVMRGSDGDIDIVTSPLARPGDWLPTGQAPFVLVMRLYDTTLGDTAAGLEGALPTIAREGCP